MATIDEKTAMKIIANSGYYPGDPRAEQVIAYDNAFGGKSWAVLYKKDVIANRYAPSDFVRNPRVLWRAKW